ncbi:Elongation factor Tu domain 2 [Paragonimus heterotremus]|uniref:Elongation factor Tu domain 2 n=1 Tax=Paragonimus heterotremus TaxID=100268 RepID=A0A8J4WUU5_9TREM|nr:Elongation factor Tu domain 2 [Paragonimus heterotremus]
MMNINVKLFYDNPNPDEFVSMVPTSAHTGDGMGDLLAALCLRLQNKLSKRLAFSEELHASVMEVKELHGLGTTIDVIIVNGRIREGDTIVLAGQEGPIATQVRGLLQPAPMSELRVKGTYQHMKEIQGAQGVKLIAKDLEKALAGLPLYVATDLGEELFYKEEVCRGLSDALKAISVAPLGVYVVASTLGSLESLLVYLKSVDIPYSGISIGTVHKKDVMKSSVMVEREPKWAVILAFDVKVDKDAQKLAAELKVKIFTSEIIYRLQTQMEEYIDDLKRGNRQKHRDLAIYPCKLRILPDMVFNKRAPIVVGVHIEAGVVRERTPLCVPSKDCIHLGRVYSIESNHKPVEEARTGQEVCIRIDPLDGETPKLYGRHFDHNDLLVSKISRESIDVMKEHFRSDLNKEDWRLMVELKKLLDIF